MTIYNTMTLTEAAAYLQERHGLTYTPIYLCQNIHPLGKLAGRKRGAAWHVTRGELDRFAAASRQPRRRRTQAEIRGMANH